MIKIGENNYIDPNSIKQIYDYGENDCWVITTIPETDPENIDADWTEFKIEGMTPHELAEKVNLCLGRTKTF